MGLDVRLVPCCPEGVIETGGQMGEQFFPYGEKPDLDRRSKRVGWQVRHLPVMTIFHHRSGNARGNPTFAAQDAYARLQFARERFSPAHRAAYGPALGVGYAPRATAPRRVQSARSAAPRAAPRTLVGVSDPSFGERRNPRELSFDSATRG